MNKTEVDDLESLKGSLLWSDEFDSLEKFQENWKQQVGGKYYIINHIFN